MNAVRMVAWPGTYPGPVRMSQLPLRPDRTAAAEAHLREVFDGFELP
jgi:hypothetical protein